MYIVRFVFFTITRERENGRMERIERRKEGKDRRTKGWIGIKRERERGKEGEQEKKEAGPP